MMIVAMDDHENPVHSKPQIKTGSGLKELSSETESTLALKLFEVMKLGKSFEECMRVVR